MATMVVSARIDEALKNDVDFYLKRAGVGPSDVIRVVWENIATTHEVPQPVIGQEPEDPLEGLINFCYSQPSCPELATMTDAQMRDLLADRYA